MCQVDDDDDCRQVEIDKQIYINNYLYIYFYMPRKLEQIHCTPFKN